MSSDAPEAARAAPEPAGSAEPDGKTYTIDDLAAATGVPSRTIRFYQAKGALPPPVRKGRVAFYDDSHADRLRVVAHLQDRGLSLRAIRDLFQRTEGADVSVAEWLGVGEQLRVPWSDDRPRVCTEDELEALLGRPVRPGLVSDLVRTGLLRRETNTSPPSYFVASPALLQLALRLEDAGVGLETADVAHDILKRQLSRGADELVEYFVKRIAEVGGPDEIMRSVNALRAVGLDAVRLVFAQEIERALRESMEQGRMLPPARKKKR